MNLDQKRSDEASLVLLCLVRQSWFHIQPKGTHT